MRKQFLVPFVKAKEYVSTANDEMQGILAIVVSSYLQGQNYATVKAEVAPLLISLCGEDYDEYFVEIWNVVVGGLSEVDIRDYQAHVAEIAVTDAFFDVMLSVHDANCITLEVVWYSKQ